MLIKIYIVAFVDFFFAFFKVFKLLPEMSKCCLRSAAIARQSHPFKEKGGINPVCLVRLVNGRYIHSPIAHIIARIGVENGADILIVFFQLFKAVKRQSAETHADIIAVENIIEIYIHMLKVRKLLYRPFKVAYLC